MSPDPFLPCERAATPDLTCYYPVVHVCTTGPVYVFGHIGMEGLNNSSLWAVIIGKTQGVRQNHMRIILLQNWAVALNANVWTSSQHDFLI